MKKYINIFIFNFSITIAGWTLSLPLLSHNIYEEIWHDATIKEIYFLFMITALIFFICFTIIVYLQRPIKGVDCHAKLNMYDYYLQTEHATLLNWEDFSRISIKRLLIDFLTSIPASIFIFSLLSYSMFHSSPFTVNWKEIWSIFLFALIATFEFTIFRLPKSRKAKDDLYKVGS